MPTSDLLKQAISELEKLPVEDQNAVATRWLEEIKDERVWASKFAATTDDQLIAQDRKGGTDWTSFAFPTWWRYDVLRGLEYLRSADVIPDERVSEAVPRGVNRRYP